jgi:uncharacterized protein (TIGR02646 family)
VIRIERNKSIPLSLQADKVKGEYARMKKFYALPAKKRGQQRFEFKFISIAAARGDISRQFNSKCAYCESPVGRSSPGLRDNFRPRNSARGFNEEFAPDHYWWLSYEWRNIYLCCEQCNRFKASWFPVKDKRSQPGASYEEVLKEYNLLIDPCNDIPEKHIDYTESGQIIPKSDKGEASIEILKLNRTELLDGRKKVLMGVKSLLNTFQSCYKNKKTGESKNAILGFYKMLQNIGLPATNEPFLGIQRWYINEWLKDNFAFALFLKGDDEFFQMEATGQFIQDLKPFKGKLAFIINLITKSYRELAEEKRVQYRKILSGDENFAIEKVEIKNFKIIKSLTINFPRPDEKKQDSNAGLNKEIAIEEPWLMLLGENAVGKSTFLQALTLALMGEQYLKKLRLKPHDLLRHNEESGFVKVYVVGLEVPIKFRFFKDNIIPGIQKPPTYLLAYGSTRLMPFGRLKPEVTTGKARALNLFRPDVSLADTSAWILDLFNKAKRSKKADELFNRIGRALKDVLLLREQDKITVIKRKVVIQYSPKSFDSLSSLSEGYKSVIALAVDIMKTLIAANTTMETARGIVLIDEIGTHLHPTWRMQVIKRFRKVFPRLQFIVTTHDPLCLRGLKKGEVIVFTKDKKRNIHINTNLPDPGGFNAEQLLNSEFFGLSSTKDPEVEEAFNKYYYLLSRKNLTEKQEKMLNSLKDYLRDKKHMGENLRDEMVLAATDKLLAETKENKAPVIRFKLEEETMKSIKEAYQIPDTNKIIS